MTVTETIHSTQRHGQTHAGKYMRMHSQANVIDALRWVCCRACCRACSTMDSLGEHPPASSARYTQHSAHKASCCWRRGLLGGAGGARGRAAQLQAAEASSPRLQHSVTGFAVTTQPLGIAEDASLEVRWQHDLPRFERASVRGASRRYGARSHAQRARQLSNDEPHLKGATTAACAPAARSPARCSSAEPAKLSCPP